MIPVKIYLPEARTAAPVVIFSHGLGGSREGNPYLGNHWAERGYVVIFPQHAGSDEVVWKEAAAGQRMQALKKAASVESFLDRARDIPAVIDALTAWNAEEKNPLAGRLDLKHIGMAGHSFGAITTQAVAGQSLAGGRLSFTEPRISAAVMMSPSVPAANDPATTFEAIRIPCLLMTGTRDDSPIGDTTPADRLKVFPNLKNAPAWQVVFDGAVHMSFGDREGENRYHRPILALTTAFWDFELKGDKAAGEWLKGDGARAALEVKDQWQMNAAAK